MFFSASDQTNLEEFRLNDGAIEGLHDVFIGPGSQGPANVPQIVFGRTANDLWPIAIFHRAQFFKEFKAAHGRHVPIEDDGIGHALLAQRISLIAVLGLHAIEPHITGDPHDDLADDMAIINNQTGFHRFPTLYSSGPILGRGALMSV